MTACKLTMALVIAIFFLAGPVLANAPAGATGGAGALNIEDALKQAALLGKQGQEARAAEQLQDFLPVVRRVGSRSQLVATLNLLGSLMLNRSYPVDQGSMATNKSVRSLRTVHKDPCLRYLSEALTLALEDGDKKQAASVLNHLGTLNAARREYDKALEKYRESSRLAREVDAVDTLCAALVNTARLNIAQGFYPEAEESLEQASTLLKQRRVHADDPDFLINMGQSYRRLAVRVPTKSAEYAAMGIAAFQDAARIAQSQNDARLSSFSYGYQGGIFEESGKIDKALELTRQALFQAQLLNAPDLLYLWQWQLGRLFAADGKDSQAAAAYQQAVHALQIIRGSIRPEYAATTLPFRDMVEPVYLGLTELLLNESSRATNPGDAQRYLTEVRDVIENLRTAELQDYMKDACIGDNDRGSFFESRSQTSTAVVYLITMPTRLEILLNLPGGIKRFTSKVNAATLTGDARELVRSISTRSDNFLPIAGRLYDSIIRPLEGELAGAKIEHLIIIPDGVLRSVPMAALHDGRSFLLDKFAISTTQGIQLVNTAPPATGKEQRMLMAGISESVHEFPPLPNVKKELKGLGELFRGTTLLDAKFKVAALKKEIEEKPYSYIHLATHGEFAGDMENMFILAYDGLINFDQLDKYVKVTKYRSEPLELLTLSACQTAAGDDRAALGLAGIAVKAGAKSTVATLWEIDDKATTELMLEFYRKLKEGKGGKSKALQYAQQKIQQKYKHPYYWSPFILIGNWL